MWEHSFISDEVRENDVYSLINPQISDNSLETFIFADQDYDTMYWLNSSGDEGYNYPGIINLGEQIGTDIGFDVSDTNRDGINDVLTTSENGILRAFQEVSCFIEFNDSLIKYDMEWDEVSGLWDYNRSFASLGNYDYNITCMKGGYETQEAFGKIILNNVLPTVTLLTPTDNIFTVNRTFDFTWVGSDSDLDSLTYEFNMTCFNVFGGGCSDDNRLVSSGSNEFYNLTNSVKYIADNGYYYNWSVRAYDGTGWGEWAIPRRINFNSLVSINLSRNSVDFGLLSLGAVDDTTDNSPLPFLIENDGNVFVNVSIYANDDLWINSLALNPSDYFRYKVDNDLSELDSFNWTISKTAFWSQVPPLLGEEIVIAHLNWSDNSDSAEIDLDLTVPPNEIAGPKQSLIVFSAEIDE